MAQDVFEKVPEFLAAYNHIAANGFFESLEANVMTSDGQPVYCLIQGQGLVPNDQKYAAPGCGVLVDPNAVIEAALKLARTNPPKRCKVKIESSEWPLWNGVDDLIGSRGTSIQFSIHIQFV